MSELINKLDATTIPVMPKEYRKYQTMNCDDAYEQGWNDLQRCIENLPSAEPHWIPVSERLPEETGEYLTTTMYGDVFCDHWQSCNFDRTEIVIAWMPLPKPYKAGEQE